MGQKAQRTRAALVGVGILIGAGGVAAPAMASLSGIGAGGSAVTSVVSPVNAVPNTVDAVSNTVGQTVSNATGSASSAVANPVSTVTGAVNGANSSAGGPGNSVVPTLTSTLNGLSSTKPSTPPTPPLPDVTLPGGLPPVDLSPLGDPLSGLPVIPQPAPTKLSSATGSTPAVVPSGTSVLHAPAPPSRSGAAAPKPVKRPAAKTPKSPLRFVAFARSSKLNRQGIASATIRGLRLRSNGSTFIVVLYSLAKAAPPTYPVAGRYLLIYLTSPKRALHAFQVLPGSSSVRFIVWRGRSWTGKQGVSAVRIGGKPTVAFSLARANVSQVSAVRAGLLALTSGPAAKAAPVRGKHPAAGKHHRAGKRG